MNKLIRAFFHLFIPPESDGPDEMIEVSDIFTLIISAGIVRLMFILFGNLVWVLALVLVVQVVNNLNLVMEYSTEPLIIS